MAAVQLDPSTLREYDIRGIIGTTLTADHYREIGRAFGTGVLREGGTSVAVGYDGRLTSPMLEAALVEGLASTGITVYRIGLGPSPMLYFAVHHLGADGGMMITGSHNPPEYNGIKMSRRGRPFFGDDIRSLGAAIASMDYVAGAGRVEDRPVADAYVARLCADICAQTVPGRALRVAWDPGNGAAAAVLRDLCTRLPGEHVLINDVVDGTFPAHHPDPTVEENLLQLREEVLRHGCDLGIAFDGDGDRIGVIDERGRILWGDQLLVLLAGPVLAELPGATIIADVKSSQVFFDEIQRLGGKPLMSRTGHSPIKKLMAETGAPLAGEMSGHVFFAHRYYGYDDALYAAVRLLSLLGGSGAQPGQPPRRPAGQGQHAGTSHRLPGGAEVHRRRGGAQPAEGAPGHQRERRRRRPRHQRRWLVAAPRLEHSAGAGRPLRGGGRRRAQALAGGTGPRTALERPRAPALRRWSLAETGRQPPAALSRVRACRSAISGVSASAKSVIS